MKTRISLCALYEAIFIAEGTFFSPALTRARTTDVCMSQEYRNVFSLLFLLLKDSVVKYHGCKSDSTLAGHSFREKEKD